jgi:DNA-binding HxlR family transcriptional regulator
VLKISRLFQTPSIEILLFLHAKGEVRYTDLTKLISSRGTLSISLKELDEEGLIQRRIVTSKPIQAYYSLTDKGKEVATHIEKAKKSLQ